MKILYDHQIFTVQKYGGISRYFYELMKEFRQINDIETFLSLSLSNNHYIDEDSLHKHYKFFPNKDFKGKYRLMTFVNQAQSIRNLKKQQFDIFHPTYYDPYFLDYLDDKPFVLTVHDMIHEKFSEIFSPNDKTTEQKRLLAEKATKIIAISQSTKKDLMEFFGTDESKIEVIYHGNSMFPKVNLKIDFKIPKRYLLFVGGRWSYKNFERFIKSVSKVLNEDKELYVLCTGGGKFSNIEINQFKKLGISNQVLQYNLDDDSLAYFYKNALAFIFPSLYEGFGIPVLESFACGCPLICSDVSSLPEVAGDAACYFNPYSEESIRDVVCRVLEDNNLRDNLINKGYDQLKKFSWKFTAEETKKVYESVLL